MHYQIKKFDVLNKNNIPNQYIGVYTNALFYCLMTAWVVVVPLCQSAQRGNNVITHYRERESARARSGGAPPSFRRNEKYDPQSRSRIRWNETVKMLSNKNNAAHNSCFSSVDLLLLVPISCSLSMRRGQTGSSPSVEPSMCFIHEELLQAGR